MKRVSIFSEDNDYSPDGIQAGTNRFAVVHTEGNLTIYELVNNQVNSSLKVVPERGGIPILFLICGQLSNGEYKLQDQVYKMKNHGFARNQPWQVLEINDRDEQCVEPWMAKKIKISVES